MRSFHRITKQSNSNFLDSSEQLTMGRFTLLFIGFVCLLGVSYAADGFDVRLHLSTVSRYGVVKDMASDSFVPTKIPDQCIPIHLNLVARHGTRAPTKKKMRDFDGLATSLEEMLRKAKEQKKSLDKIPGWMWKWESPWKGKATGGELIRQGEDELYHLGVRVRQTFPELFHEDYHSDIYPIKATQVPRSSASAVAFGMGLFSEKGNLGPGHHRAFAVISESRASDTMLRFHDCCQNYKGFRKSQEPAVDKLKQPVLDEVARGLFERYGLDFTSKDASSLWSLCKQEASLLETTDQACELFTPHEVALLEWTDDLEMFILKAYGNSLNYRMGVPLLKDVIQSMEDAIKNREEGNVSGSYEKARMRIAHAETLVPFSCLLGLFLEKSEFELIRREESLQLPPKPTQKRNWRGNIVAPFAGNNMLVLYSCPDIKSSKYFIRILHNEHSVPMPGCNNTDFCPFEVFKQEIVAPHLKHNYETLCSLTEKQPEKPYPASWLSRIFTWPWSNANAQARSFEL